MAASVRIEDEAFSDGRFDELGALLGTSKFDALGRCAFLWRQCCAQQTYVLRESFVRVFCDPEHLISVGLAERCDGGIRVRGTKGRIEWLGKLRKAARKGGRALSAIRHASRHSETVPQGMPSGCPSASASASVDQEGEPPKPADIRPHRIPPSWKPGDSEPNQVAQDAARARGVDLQEQLAKMHDWARDSGKKGKDWDARWRNWIRDARPSFGAGTWNGNRKQPTLVLTSDSDEPDLSHTGLGGAKP